MIDQGSGPNSTTAVAATSHDPTDKTLAELLSDLSQELASLMHQELDLAKAEVTAKGKRMGVGAALVVGAGVVAFLGLAAVVACVIAALSEALAVWLAALLVGVVLLAIAGVLGVLGKTDIQRASPPVPQEAVDSTKEDVAWLKTQVKSAKP
jgi:nucleoside permease NupC